MWTEERVELLKKLWAEGLSASQVAKQLGGVTRNAVIGKVHRLGLSNRATTASAKPATASKAEAKSATEPKPKAAPKPATVAKPVAPEPSAPVPMRRAIIPAGQPLPPQPSANEISPEALAKVNEVEKKANRLSLL